MTQWLRESVIFAVFDYLKFFGIFSPENAPVTQPEGFRFGFPYFNKFPITKNLSYLRASSISNFQNNILFLISVRLFDLKIILHKLGLDIKA